MGIYEQKDWLLPMKDGGCIAYAMKEIGTEGELLGITLTKYYGIDYIWIMEIKGVKIGDKFKYQKYGIGKVVDFHIVTSLKTGKLVQYLCVAKLIDSLATNEFEIPFATVIRNKTK